MATVAEVGVNLRARTGQFDAAMSRAGKSMLSFRRAALAAIGVGSAIQIARGFGEIANEIDRIGKLSTRLAVSTETLSQLRLVASKSGVEFEALAKGMADAAKRITDAASGRGEAVTAIAQLGLDARELAALKPEEQLLAIADAFKVLGDDTSAINLAQKLFGESGAQLLQTLRQGSSEIQSIMQQADDVGGTLSDASVREVERMNDRIGVVKTFFKSMAEEAVAANAKVFNMVVDAPGKAQDLGKRIGQKMSQGMGLGAALRGAVVDTIGGVERGEFTETARAEERRLAGIRTLQIDERRKGIAEQLREIYGEIAEQQKVAAQPTSVGAAGVGDLSRIAFGRGVGISGGRAQKVESPQLDTIIEVLRRMLSQQGTARAT